MPTQLYVRDAEGGPWRRYDGELLPGGAVAPGAAAARVLPRMSFVLSADLGQVNDFTALVVVETHWTGPGDGGAPVYAHDVSHLERHRGISYPAIAARIVRLCAELPAPPLLVVDETGVGRAVCDDLRLANPRSRCFMPITITSGQDATAQPDGSWHVAKRLLVGRTQIALQNRRLRVGRNLPMAAELVREMLSFRAKITPAGNVVYGAPDTSDWRTGVHDDMTLAVALAVWAVEDGIGAPTRFY